MNAELWIQAADYSTPVKTSVDSASEAIRHFDSFDWLSALKMGLDRSARDEDHCPVGMGVVRDDATIIHVCPAPDMNLSVVWHSPFKRKFWGIFRKRIEPFETVGLSRNDLDKILRLFLNRQDAALAEVLKVETP